MSTKSELYARNISGAVWAKSIYSEKFVGECVEVAELSDGAVAVRDSKNRDRPELRFTAGEWAAFVKAVHWGQF